MKHTYLVTPARWIAAGSFTDNSGTVHKVSGTSVVTHDRGIWLNRTAMTIHTDPISDMECVYEIMPLSAGKTTTTWTAETLPLGRMFGTFALVDNTILSCAHTPEGINMETMRYIDDDTYENRGVLILEGIMLSSWQLTLTRA